MTFPTTRLARLARLVRRAIVVLLVPPTTYFLLAVAGLLPVNSDFRMADADGVTIYVVHNGVHTDLVLPTVRNELDWREWFPAGDFANPSPHAEWVQFGWGDRLFYVETPTWEELKLQSALRAALWPTDTAMHVQFCDRPQPSAASRRLRISEDQYQRLVAALRSSFQQDQKQRPIRLEHPGYNAWDAFYAAEGSYHLFHTCNCWSGRMLRQTGVRVGVWTPFPQSVMWTLPSEVAESQLPPAGSRPGADKAAHQGDSPAGKRRERHDPRVVPFAAAS